MHDKASGVDLRKTEEDATAKPTNISQLLDDRNVYFTRIVLLLYVRLFAFVVGVILISFHIFIYLQDKDLFKLIFTLISASIPFIVIFLVTKVIKDLEAKIDNANAMILNKISPD